MVSKFLEQLNPIVKKAYLEYEEKSESLCMPMLEENGDDRRFYVYEWFTKEPEMIFYVGKGTGKRYNHIISDMNRPRGDLYVQLQNKYDIEYRIALNNLTEQEATIYETYLIWKREQEGEVLIQFVFAESFWYGLDDERDKIELGIKPNIWIEPITKRYFSEKITEKPEYDEVEYEYLKNAHLIWEHTREAKLIKKYIENRGGRVYKTMAKNATCVIEFNVTKYNKYLEYREKGYKVYHFLDVLEFLKNNRIQKEVITIS